MFCVYRITEISTNRSYIGQCKKENYKRRNYTHFCKDDGCKKLWDCIDEYIKNNKNPKRFFKSEILIDDISTQKMAWFAESYLIKYYHTIEFGFNTTPGGKNCGVIGHKLSPESRAKISDTMRKRGHYIRTEEQKKKTSEGLKKYYANKLGTHPYRVLDIMTGIEYDSLKSASKDIGCRDSDISNQLKGRQKTVKGHVFKRL